MGLRGELLQAVQSIPASHHTDRQVDDLFMVRIWLLDEFILCDIGNLSFASDGSCHAIPELSGLVNVLSAQAPERSFQLSWMTIKLT